MSDRLRRLDALPSVGSTATADDGVPVSGAIPRVEAHPSHRAFVRAARPRAILVSITDARRLLGRGETASSYYGADVDVITTTTIRDEYLRWIEPTDEFEIVSAFGSDAHVPADRSVYADQSDDEQLTRSIRYLESVLWLADRFDDHRVSSSDDRARGTCESAGRPSARPELVPLVKGLRPPERAVAYRAFDDVGVRQLSFYGAQYFSGGGGPRSLVADVGEVASETSRPLFVIGLLSPRYLSRLPETVVAAAGLNRWREAVAPHEHAADPGEMRRRWTEFAAEVNLALSNC